MTGYNGIGGTGNQNSCLKFYAYDYEVGDTEVKLLLDHNTTAGVTWNSSLGKLKTATSSWKGTKTPANYTVTQEEYGNYIIDYSDYKARLITANEVDQITGNTNFDESTTRYSNYFYFDSLTTSQATDCKNGDTSGCSYKWLYDRTSTSCTTDGCENNSDAETSGYWTSTTAFGYRSGAWFVSCGDSLCGNHVNNAGLGVRPVITVSKSNL